MNKVFSLLRRCVVGGVLVTVLCSWSIRDFTRRYDARSVPITAETYPVVVLGSGPGALMAGTYTSLANFETLIVKGPTPGGALTGSHEVRNWPGGKRVRGLSVMDNMIEQAEDSGAVLVNEEVTSADFSDWPYSIRLYSPVTDKRRTVKALAVVIATGATPNRLGVPGENEYWGRGVTTCAVCDGALYRGKDVVVVGGGDAAMEEAGYLSGLAKSVTILVRANQLRARDKRKDYVAAQSNVRFMYNTRIAAIEGKGDDVKGVTITSTNSDETGHLDTAAVFLAIGSQPNTSYFADQLRMKNNGYIDVHSTMATSIPGVFAVGDCVDAVYRQAVTAAGDGCRAALTLIDFLLDKNFDPNDWNARRSEIEKPAPRFEAGNEVLEIKSRAQFDEKVKKSPVPVVVDFYATWCGPCRAMAPVFKALAAEYEGEVGFAKVNIDAHKALTNTYSVKEFPTFLVFKNGKLIKRIVGSKARNVFKTEIDRSLNR